MVRIVKTEFYKLKRYHILWAGVALINKIDTLLKQPNCPFVLFVGTRKLVKRREFEEYIRRELII